MVKVDHPNVINVFEYYLFKFDLFFSMEYLSGNSLFEHITKNKDHLTENRIRDIMKQILEGVNAIHSSNIVHCDIKPENIIFEDQSENSKLKIIDLGIGQILKCNSYLTTLKGTLPYISPELIYQKYDNKVDIWAVGVILFILVTGQFPFAGYVKDTNGELIMDNSQTQIKILEKEPDYDHDCFKGVDLKLIHLLKLMLIKDPNQRPSAKELLTHDWFGSTEENPLRKESNFLIESVE